jgi:hypothetical protein
VWLDSRATDEDKEDKNDYIPGLYLQSSWIPPSVPTHIENGLAAFEGTLNDHLEQHTPDHGENLRFFQCQAMKKLQDDPKIHICDTEKNLGLAVIGNKVYLKQLYEERLTSSSTYFRLN